MEKHYEPKFILYYDCIDPDVGGIQNTAYCFLQEIKKKYSIKSLSGKLKSDIDKSNIMEMEDINLAKALIWVLKNSDKKTWNIAMNCWTGLPAYLAKKLRGSHYFVLAHGNDVYDIAYPKKGLKPKIWKSVNTAVLKRADFVACNSHYTLELLRNLKLEHTYIIPPPCDIHKNTDDISYDPDMIFSVGRLVERKGFQFVIEAISILKKEFPQIKYYIAGSGEYENILVQKIRELDLKDAVFLMGNVDDATKTRYMKQCGIFIMPSIEMPNVSSVEGFGIVYIEANQFGKYVIGSRSGGIPEAICPDETGSILNVVTGETIAVEIRKVLTNMESYYTNDLIKKRQKWAEKHSPENIVRQYLKIVNLKSDR